MKIERKRILKECRRAKYLYPTKLKNNWLENLAKYADDLSGVKEILEGFNNEYN